MCVLLLHGIGGVVDTISTGFRASPLRPPHKLTVIWNGKFHSGIVRVNFMACFCTIIIGIKTKFTLETKI